MRSLYFNWKIGKTEKWIELRRESLLIPGYFYIIMKFRTWFKFYRWLKNYIKRMYDVF